MLFHSSLRKELARGFGASLVVLATVVMTMTLIRILGQASRGRLDVADVTLIMGYTVLSYTPTLLALSLFIAIVATLSRIYRESEMVIWFGSGQGLVAVLRPLFRFAWPIFAAIGLLSLVVVPWTNLHLDELRQTHEQRSDLKRIEPGEFKESADGSKVFFIDKSSTTATTGTNVFISTTEPNKQTITSARSGNIESFRQGQFLMLNNGQRLEIAQPLQTLKIIEFNEYGTRIQDAVLNSAVAASISSVSSAKLLKNPSSAAWGEISWRLGMLFAAVNLVVIGTAVSNSNPRVGRSVNTLFAMLSFILYLNLISLGQSWIGSGKVSFATFMLTLHGGVALVAWIWLARCHFNWHWRLRARKLLPAPQHLKAKP